MMILPVAFVPVIVNFPVGLVIYWVTTNLWTVGQGLVTRQLDAEGGGLPPKRSSRTPPKIRAAEQGRRRGARRHKPAAPPRAAAPRASGRRRRRGVDGGPAPGRGDRRDRRRGEVGRAPRAREAPPGARQGRRSLPGRLRGRARAARRRLCAGASRRTGRRGGRREAPTGTATASSAAEVRDLLERITAGIGVRCRIDILEDDETVTASCSGSNLGLLIGKHGQTIDAIQYLANAIVWRSRPDDRKEVVVDAAGYRDRRRAALESLALRSAEEALATRSHGRARADDGRRAEDRAPAAEVRSTGSRPGARARSPTASS